MMVADMHQYSIREEYCAIDMHSLSHFGCRSSSEGLGMSESGHASTCTVKNSIPAHTQTLLT